MSWFKGKDFIKSQNLVHQFGKELVLSLVAYISYLYIGIYILMPIFSIGLFWYLWGRFLPDRKASRAIAATHLSKIFSLIIAFAISLMGKQSLPVGILFEPMIVVILIIWMVKRESIVALSGLLIIHLGESAMGLINGTVELKQSPIQQATFSFVIIILCCIVTSIQWYWNNRRRVVKIEGAS
jgi:hypothetical protein